MALSSPPSLQKKKAKALVKRLFRLKKESARVRGYCCGPSFTLRGQRPQAAGSRKGLRVDCVGLWAIGSKCPQPAQARGLSSEVFCNPRA